MENETHKKLAYEQFTTINKKVYPIIKHKAKNALEAAQGFLNIAPEHVDFIFFDLPGAVSTPGILCIGRNEPHFYANHSRSYCNGEYTCFYSAFTRCSYEKKGNSD